MLRRKYRYDVSFSFAEEDCAFVQEVADHLKRWAPSYYYYKEDLVSNWGKDLEQYLSPIYGRQSRLCVIFVSAAYRDKVWTQFELERATERAKRNIPEYILPFKMDDTELPEISSRVKYLSRKEIGAEDLAVAIRRKIDEHRERDGFPIWLRGQIRYYFRKPVFRIALSFLIALLCGMLLWDHLTPVELLARQLYNRGRQKIRGSVCKDGWYSKSRGRGACSSHGGVLYNKDSVMPMKTVAASREEAEATSWLEE